MINTFYNMLENKMIQSLNLSCIVFRHIILYFHKLIILHSTKIKKCPRKSISNEKYIKIGHYINISSILNTLKKI